jgi:hypothetical protein
MGVDIEQKLYQAIPADPRDDEAPVLGNASPATNLAGEPIYPRQLLRL